MEGFKEVDCGIWEPIEAIYFNNKDEEIQFLIKNSGKSIVLDKSTNEVVCVFKYGLFTDVVSIMHSRYGNNIRIHGGFPEPEIRIGGILNGLPLQ